ncbi:hypothetical protein JYT50_00210 [bacterium AH-315-A23]|nr:hypothetical protein [bacterium AH-315-A23]PHS53290.1 MAG: hypothetical protein COB01_04940 [Lutibacter sp.]
MKGVYRYTILEEINLIIQFYQGDITLSGLKNMKRNLFRDKCYNPEYKVLSDVRLSNNSLTLEEVEEYGTWVGKKLQAARVNLNTILTSTPQQVVQSMMFSLNKNLKKDSYMVFSTLESALLFLKIDISYFEVIETEIDKIKDIPRTRSVF